MRRIGWIATPDPCDRVPNAALSRGRWSGLNIREILGRELPGRECQIQTC
jgi:hypothetical protein